MLNAFLLAAMAAAPAPQIIATPSKTGYDLKLSGGSVYRTASKPITKTRTERLADGVVVGFYQEGSESRYLISKDGKTVLRDVAANYALELKYATFDPLKFVPAKDDSVPTSATNEVYVIQFKTQMLDAYRAQLEAAGVELYDYFTNYAFLARIPASSMASVRTMPFVRWTGAYESAWRLDPEVMTELRAGTLVAKRYNIWCHVRGPQMQNDLAAKIRVLGGVVEEITPEGFRMSATLSPAQLKQVLAQNEVSFVDPWSAPEQDMDNVRTYGGGNFVETLGFTGHGVRAEVMDGGLLTTHSAWGNAPITHAGTLPVDSHGTATFGINFGNGAGNAAGRGMMPNAQGVMANYNSMVGTRYNHTAQLLAAPYFCVYQSNSWGSALTTSYNATSAEMDDILFNHDITILNSQSNAGTRNSRPQAWAKNVVSIGAFNHFNNLNDADDRWSSGASIGPATDGRVKPDLAFWYDNILCPTSSGTTAYTSSFGGTSAATPMTAGHFGLFFQMWNAGLFNVPVPGATVFDNRPKATLAKAIMINTARQRVLPAVSPNDINRNVQGWGLVNLTDLHAQRNNMIVVNETVPLNNLETFTYKMTVAAGQPAFKVTMGYLEPAGTVGAAVTRKNNLSLRVTGPTGTIWWGNNGMAAANWTASGGAENSIDTIENVFIQNPAAGTYTVQVIGSDINTDARPETPGVNADFALVATFAQNAPMAPTAFSVLDGGLLGGTLTSLAISDNDRVRAARGLTSTKSTFQATTEMTFTSPLSTHSKGSLVLERSSAISGIGERIQLFNVGTSQWDSSPSEIVPTADGTRTYSVANLAPYVNGSGQIRVRLVHEKADPTMPRTATVDIDFARMSVEPN